MNCHDQVIRINISFNCLARRFILKSSLASFTDNNKILEAVADNIL